MSVHRSISLWGAWYLQWKSTPKNEVLRLKTLDFWRLSEYFESEEIGVTWRLGNHSRNMKREDFCFFSFIFSFLSHRKHRTVKGGRGKTKENFHVMLNSKSYTYQFLRVKPLEISYSSVNFFSDRDKVLLVAEEFVLTEELGIRQCGLPTQWGTW